MGLLDFLSCGKSGGDSTASAQARISLADFAARLGGLLGEQFVFQAGKRPGYVSKSGVVGVYMPDQFMVEQSMLREAEQSMLSYEGGSVGLKGGSRLSADLFDKILMSLKEEELPYRVFIAPRGDMPAVINTEKGNIIIAPIISLP